MGEHHSLLMGSKSASTNSKFDLGDDDQANSPISKFNLAVQNDMHVTPQYRVPMGANRELDFDFGTPYIFISSCTKFWQNSFYFEL